MVLLTDFLSDDFGGALRVEKAAPDDQTHDLVGAPVIGFGPWLLREQTLGALLVEVGQELVVALAAEAVFLSGFDWAQVFALALDEHGQTAADLIVVGNQERTARTCEAELGF